MASNKKRKSQSSVTLISSRSGTATKARRSNPKKEIAGIAGSILDVRGTGRALAVTSAEADVTDEIGKGGPAFGTFLQRVGEAVANSQKQLDESLVATAKALSETTIDVIAVFEQVLDDNTGGMTAGNIQKQKLPLINYLMPTAYHFSRVYLQADMNVAEFNGTNGMVLKGKADSIQASAKASYGVLSGGFGVSGSAAYGRTSYSTSSEASTSTNSAVGSLHMEATLEPRQDIELPKPFILQKGPQVQIRTDSSAPIPGTASGSGAPVANVGRKVTLKARLTKTDGSPHTGQVLRINVSEPQFNHDPVPLTDSNGEVSIIVKNEWGTGVTADPPRKQALVSVSFGLVNQSIGISL